MRSKLFTSVIVAFLVVSCKAQELSNANIQKTINGTEIGVSVDGNKQGNWVYYDNDLSLYKICFYKNNMLEGRYIKFNSKGDISMMLNFEKGRLNGKADFYSSKGVLLATYIYSNDIIKEIKFYVIDDESPPRNHDFLPQF